MCVCVCVCVGGGGGGSFLPPCLFDKSQGGWGGGGDTEGVSLQALYYIILTPLRY